VAGIDVGEDFLDVATLHESQHLRLTRINLRDIPAAMDGPFDTNAVESLSAILLARIPQLRGALVLIDSPRWPSDLEWSKARGGSWRSAEPKPDPVGSAEQPKETALRAAPRTARSGSLSFQRSRREAAVTANFAAKSGRQLDGALRALVHFLRTVQANSTLTSLSMFPTPPLRYFGAHLNALACKPHLRMLGQALFGQLLNRNYGAASGGIFTRFMIAGFALYQALEAIGGEPYECYPDLQFRLWCRGLQLASKKKAGSAAFASRLRVLSVLAQSLGVSGFEQLQRLDEADAAILALSVIGGNRRGAIFILENRHEGRFMVALDEPDALHLQQSRGYLHRSFFQSLERRQEESLELSALSRKRTLIE